MLRTIDDLIEPLPTFICRFQRIIELSILLLEVLGKVLIIFQIVSGRGVITENLPSFVIGLTVYLSDSCFEIGLWLDLDCS